MEPSVTIPDWLPGFLGRLVKRRLRSAGQRALASETIVRYQREIDAYVREVDRRDSRRAARRLRRAVEEARTRPGHVCYDDGGGALRYRDFRMASSMRGSFTLPGAHPGWRLAATFVALLVIALTLGGAVRLAVWAEVIFVEHLTTIDDIER
ncbi:MAG: hypothetical protein HY608_11790 [Planctomycetes bacterium]|nr:hypothetical protein [Planctomycetota bacterium]